LLVKNYKQVYADVWEFEGYTRAICNTDNLYKCMLMHYSNNEAISKYESSIKRSVGPQT